MKLSFIPLVAAYWDQSKICDEFAMNTVDFEIMTDMSMYECQQWCYQAERDAFPSVPAGTVMCCDYEQWDLSGNSDCSLYKGNARKENRCNSSSICDDTYASFLFYAS